MGKILDLMPPSFRGNWQEYAQELERYLFRLQEQVDHELYKLRKTTAAVTEEEKNDEV